jgi:BirA family biotin operon repressor/biotin-[acetyl-CoA-carboxylase] ligase
MFDKNAIQSSTPWLADVKVLTETPSTQSEAKRGPTENVLYLTSRQTATYGRFGRRYFAANSGGIYMSIALKPEFTDVARVTLLAASAVVTAIEQLTDKRPMIKWVNDIYLADKKIVGILAEAQAGSAGVSRIILGMGINFQIGDFPPELAERASSLFLADEKVTISPEQLIAAIWQDFYQLADKDFIEIYRAHNFILGKTVRFRQNQIDYEGKAVGLTEQGELVVEFTDGSKKILNSGEISLKKWI